ncbi:MAG: hypothetical protein KAY24_20180 [Candidatus Eisenbacteria sp.]|nr:hypothetical protein [Candidatus Eisenbacteria bacterium]
MDPNTRILLKAAQDNYEQLERRISKAEARITQLNDVQTELQLETDRIWHNMETM